MDRNWNHMLLELFLEFLDQLLEIVHLGAQDCHLFFQLRNSFVFSIDPLAGSFGGGFRTLRSAFRQFREQLGIASLFAARLTRQQSDHGEFAFHQLPQDHFNRRQVAEGMHPLTSCSQLAYGLGATQQQFA